MPSTTAPRAGEFVVPATSAQPSSAAIDWEAAIKLPAFTELLRRRRRFVVPAALGAFAWITVWLVLVAYAHDLMGTEIVHGVSVMLVTGLSQFVVAWALAAAYLRRARRVWAPLQRQAIAQLDAARAGERG
jgi:uncharacterized membrane protein (DUF485 family)